MLQLYIFHHVPHHRDAEARAIAWLDGCGVSVCPGLVGSSGNLFPAHHMCHVYNLRGFRDSSGFVPYFKITLLIMTLDNYSFEKFFLFKVHASLSKYRRWG